MHDESLWLEIAWLCLLISLMAIGGANAMVPEIHRYVIEQRGWMRGAWANGVTCSGTTWPHYPIGGLGCAGYGRACHRPPAIWKSCMGRIRGGYVSWPNAVGGLGNV